MLTKETKYLTFDDVLIKPKYNTVSSRKDVNLSSWLGLNLTLPVISANMDTITGPEMAKVMRSAGGVGALHRFSTPEQRLKDFKNLYYKMTDVFVSIGVGDQEFEVATELYKEGARLFIIDVAHGASQAVVEQLKRIKDNHLDAFVMVGNFATKSSVVAFIHHCNLINAKKPDAIKVGVGPGSMCTTRIKTGCGVPQLSAINEISHHLSDTSIKVVADGGMKSPGDIAKALAAGADAVMIGGMFAGTEETPGELVYESYHDQIDYSTGKLIGRIGKGAPKKKYRGSASLESYKIQGKDESWRAAEGESVLMEPRGSVLPILNDIEGGLRSAFTYVGAKNMYEFKQNSEFIEVSRNSLVENGSHGK